MELLAYGIKTVIMFVVTTIAIRVIGKKSISEMTAFDLAATVMITTVASEPLVFKIASKATYGVIILTLATVALGWLTLHNSFRWIDGESQILIDNGKINEKGLQRSRMNIPILLSELRVKGYQNVADIEFAILEVSGKLSVIPKSQIRPVRPKDLNIPTSYEGLALPLIINGGVQWLNLRWAKLDQKWLMDQLNSQGITDVKDVSLAQLDTSGKLYIDRFYQGDNETLHI